jgi:hypothetical protein
MCAAVLLAILMIRLIASTNSRTKANVRIFS